MEFTLPADVLGAALGALKGTVERRATLPILANVLLSLAGDRLTLTGTDLESQIQTSRTVQGAVPGAITVPLERLLGIVRTLPDVDVRAKVDEDRMLLSAGRARFRIQTLPAENYPAFTASAYGPAVTIGAAKLARAIAAVSHAMARADVRHYLNGLLLTLDADGGRVVASDGHRLSTAAFEGEPDWSPVSVILPRKAVLELAKLLPSGGDVAFRYAANAAEFGMEAATFSTKLIEGRFPDWRRVFPQDLPIVMRLEREPFIAALRRVGLMANEAGAIAVELRADGVALRGGVDAGDSSEDFVPGELSGAPTALGFNWSYLEDALCHLDAETVELAVTAQGNSAVLRDPENSSVAHVVMPMRF
jgi:DNA polymerase-3 subunit beta